MKPYASVDDLAAGWRILSPSEEDVAKELLIRASAQLNTLLTTHGIAVNEDDEVQAINLKTVACSIVRRSMVALDAPNVSSMSQTIGSTSGSITFSNPDGSFYLSKQDKELLGITGSGGLRQIRAAIHNPDGSLVNGW